MAPQRKTWESLGPTWRWYTGGALAVAGFFIVLWMTDVSKSLAATAASSQQSADAAVKALAVQAERIAIVESRANSTDQRLGRIEASQDRAEAKLNDIDKALRRK